MVYKFREGSRFVVSAQVAGEEISRIAGVHGTAAPETVVEESRPEEAPLHDAFEWVDAIAAEEHRKYQARQLIHCLVRVESEADTDGVEQPKEIQAFASVTPPGVQRGYMPTNLITSDEELNQQMINDAWLMYQGLKRRFEHLGGLKEFFATLDAAMEAARQEADRRARRVATRAKAAKAKRPVQRQEAGV